MFDLDARPGSLLTYGNPKTAKGEGYGVLTAVMHFAVFGFPYVSRDPGRASKSNI